ncbi:hypothetical protein OHA27_37915 [Streptomyces sp. NBC_01619]|uniref:hypothetical protein n=1 Tax=Streptomyces sp. NBC_01619 TaxID=2975901 RepID=UPI00224CEF78|nr:hypothetical protein [Streptomyces sp. NBC_01619]MCX4515898.1 hypothetical protein [Streptomyces sp. NBC_01619]
MTLHMHRAYAAIDALLTALGPGRHDMTCSAEGACGQLVLACITVEVGSIEPTPALASVVPHGDSRVFAIILATSMETGGALVTRSYRNGAPDVARGWRTRDGWPQPLTEAEVFSAYCTDAVTGDPLPPEADVTYGAGFELISRS